jgi:membrane-associated phospholipid phosphatase
MDGIYQIGIALIQWLQGASPALDGFMKAITFLGTIEFYIIFIPVLYWCVDQKLGLRVLFLLILADFMASYFKQLLHQPRPYWIGDVKALGLEPTYGIPSSHASNTLAVWGLIADRIKKSWMWVFTVLLLFLIGLSRLYLGVHFPQDVLGGWLLGLVMLLVFLNYEVPFLDWWTQKTVSTRIWLGFLLSMALILIGLLVLALISGVQDPPEWASFATEARDPSYYLTLGGFTFGAVAGVTLMQEHASFKMEGSVLQRVGRYALGIIVLFALYLGLDVLFALFAPDASLAGYVLRFIRYASVSFWAIFGAPWVFVKTGLAERQ